MERYGFETVTVYRRAGRELVCVGAQSGCWVTIGHKEGMGYREDAEAWCVEKLKPPEPKWRPAREDGSDNGEPCRFRDSGEPWCDGKLLMHEATADGPWVVLFDGIVSGWDECEVLDE